MGSVNAERLYENYYRELNFERGDLFALLRKNYPIHSVIYPGSSIHIAPSFYFSYVVYVDIGDLAVSFFSEERGVQDLIDRYKTYSGKSSFRFLKMDYTKPLPFAEGEFDLLISLYAPAILLHNRRYVRRGGLILTNNHLNELALVEHETDLKPLARILWRDGRYRFAEPASIANTSRKGDQLNRSSTGLKFVDREVYYLFEKL